MKVYRVETADGQGPYTNPSICKIPNWTRLYDEDHPGPVESGINDVQLNEYFGFTSKEDLGRWFGPLRKQMKMLDLHTYEYEVHPKYVRAGDKQAVFVMDAASSRRKLH